MFYAHHILHRRRGKFGMLWMAAASPKFVGKAQLMAVSLSSMSEALKSDLTHGIAGRQSLRFSLRLSCRLVTGLWVLYRKKTALTRALAEQCLKMLIQRRKHQTTLNIDLPPPKRQKSAKFETDTTANFGKVTQLLAAPEAGAGDEAVEMPAGLTVDAERITLREEQPTMQSAMLEDEMIPFESVQAEDVGEFFDELEKMMSKLDRQPAVAPTGVVEQALAAGEPVARPISPILRVESRTPPPHLTSPRGSPLPRLEGPAIEPEVREEMLAEPLPGAEPLPEAEPSMRAEPRPSTAEDELPGVAPIVPKAEPPADAAPLPVQPDVDTAAMPPPASRPVSPPTQRQRRRRVPRSPALGEPPRRRRRASHVIIDREVQISVEEMRQNIYSMSLEIHKREYVMALPKLQSVDVLFRQPGRRLLSDQLLRPWKRIKTMPEPDDLEPLVTNEELIPEPAVAPVVEPAAEPVAEPVAEPAAEPLVEPPSEQLVVAEFADRIGESQEMPSVREEGSLEAPRDPSLQDTSGASADGRAVGKTSMVRVMGGIPEEEPQVQAPGDEEFQLPIPDEQAPLDVPEPVPVVPIIPPADHVEDFSEVPPGERSPLSRVWGRLLQFVDEHGMCTLSILVTPDVFNRRTVASTFGALLRLHKRGLVRLSQDQPYGPIVIEVCQQEEGTPVMAYHQNP